MPGVTQFLILLPQFPERLFQPFLLVVTAACCLAAIPLLGVQRCLLFVLFLLLPVDGLL